MKTLLKGGILVTMDPGRGIYEGDLLIEDDHIASLASAGSVDETRVDQVLDCRGKIIIPGLVSAHSHFTGILQRGLWDETTFEPCSSRSTATERRLNPSPESIYVAHCAACIELLRHGVTTALNMFTAPDGIPMGHVDQAFRALRDSGIRGILAISLRDQATNNEEQGTHPVELDACLARVRDAATRVGGYGARVSFMLAPSAPQRCSDRLLQACAALTAELKIGLHTHLSETKSHAEVGQRLYRESIVRHLQRIGFLGPHLSVAHSIWLDEFEIELLGQYDVKIVHNPSSNMKLGSGVARVRKMLEKGLTVALGADSVNAGTVYSIFEQMKLCVLLPRTAWGPKEWVSPEQAFEMATLGCAKALLLGAVSGSIEEGKKADLVVLGPSTTLLPQNKLVTQLALSEGGESVESVFVNGQPVILNRTFKTLDEAAILKELLCLGPRVVEAAKLLN